MTTNQFETQTKALIDGLKQTCASYGLGNDGNEFKIITQVFLYKFLNDKFAHELKQIDLELANAEEWEIIYREMDDSEAELLRMQLPASVAKLMDYQLIDHLWSKQDQDDFAKTFDETLADIAVRNADVFSVQTDGKARIRLFDRLTEFIADQGQRNAFAKALINHLVEFSFEPIFGESFDFFATIFEYLISDYNKDSGGKYAEYYTPHAVAKIMAAILVTEEADNIKIYDPSAGSGTLLMNLAHKVGEDRCTVYSQDISQKSSGLLRLNLILNNLVASIPNVIKGNTILNPAHRNKKGRLREYDYIVANPPFKLDFSDFISQLGEKKENKKRFFAGYPNVPPKKKSGMAIYPLFIQHIMHTLKKGGKAAIVIPTGFLTAQNGADKKIREKLIEKKMLMGVVSMPSNIFATTGTNVSILFLHKGNPNDTVLLMDASGLGEKVKEGKNQKTVLTTEEEDRIIDVFNAREVADDFTVAPTFAEVAEKNFSFSAGQYFDVKIEYMKISDEDFKLKLDKSKSTICELQSQGISLHKSFLHNLNKLQK